MEEFSNYLNKKFLEWQLQTGRKQSLQSFARYLGVKYTSLTGWINGIHPPSDENLRLLAHKLGPEIYKTLNKIPPDNYIEDSQLISIAEAILQYPPEYRTAVRSAILETLEQTIHDHLPPENTYITHKFLENLVKELEESNAQM